MNLKVMNNRNPCSEYLQIWKTKARERVSDQVEIEYLTDLLVNVNVNVYLYVYVK